MEPIFGFPITLPAAGSRELLRALHGQLRAAILDGRLRPGLRLPATRELASALAISRNTVVAAYDLLLSEGYLVARRGAGNYVAEMLARRETMPSADVDIATEHRLAPYWRQSAGPFSPRPPRSYRHDFSLGAPDYTQFPFEIWRRLSARALRLLSRSASVYRAAEGRPALREAIAVHISFARAVACRTEDVIVTSGAQQAFDLLARVLVTPGQTTIAVEDPGYPPLRAAFMAVGAKVVAVPVDDEGLLVDRLPMSTNVIYVTPSHQFPLGAPLSPMRRAALLAFAAERGAVVIEDDYDGEFRYGERPLDALQTLDRDGSVCYVGTFSKCLFPALRVGYVVAPPWLRASLAAAKQLADWHGDVLTQDTLAMFIAEGHLVRHIRRMRKLYGERRRILLEALHRHGGTRLQALPSVAGLHLAARLAPGVDADALLARAAEEGILVESLRSYAMDRSATNGLAFGFGLVEAQHIDAAVRQIMQRMDG